MKNFIKRIFSSTKTKNKEQFVLIEKQGNSINVTILEPLDLLEASVMIADAYTNVQKQIGAELLKKQKEKEGQSFLEKLINSIDGVKLSDNG